ncbi:hypothetical protein L1987_80594 [Smallanthus sonchifolius]|uniref:Uncharacterized protein n=1 Tax=Smallanthus sonchifolius TaxID=185202 RepID=A0ACB8YPN6_9ASTR|nr:hypothetical protein L1987_80594 [Smallanthus sonchifolius]
MQSISKSECPVELKPATGRAPVHVSLVRKLKDYPYHVGMLVQDPRKMNDVESLFNQAKQAGAEEGTLDQFQPSSSSRSFSGRGRLLSGEMTHTITFLTNGFTVIMAL